MPRIDTNEEESGSGEIYFMNPSDPTLTLKVLSVGMTNTVTIGNYRNFKHTVNIASSIFKELIEVQ